MDKLFFELLQVAIGNRERLSRPPSEKEWWEVYHMAVKQSVVGLLFSAVEKLNADDSSLKPGASVFYQWLGEVAQIEERNKRMNEAVRDVVREFREGGLQSCVLKGQGLARLYPEPLRRQSGDIDMWVKGGRDNTLRFLKNQGYVTGAIVIHHVDAKIVDGVETEVHFLPHSPQLLLSEVVSIHAFVHLVNPEVHAQSHPHLLWHNGFAFETLVEHV